MNHEPLHIPKSEDSNHSFRNMMLLIIFALLMRGWANYLPQHALTTLSMAHDRIGNQINAWLGLEPMPQIDYSSIITQTTGTTTGSTTGTVINTGDTTNQPRTIDVGRTADTQTTGTTTGSTPSTQSTMRDELDSTEGSQSTNPTSGQTTPITTDPTMSIEIGGHTIMVDGTPDEDIIINASGYRVIIEKN